MKTGKTLYAFTALVLACASIALAQTPTAAPSLPPAATSLADMLRATILHQCTLLTSSDFDGYKATMTDDFHRIGPYTGNITRDQVMNSLAMSKRLGIHQANCTVTVDAASITPSGAQAHYTETDTNALQKSSMNLITVATADFVKAPDGTWLEQQVRRDGYQIVGSGKVIIQEGTVNGVTVTPAPSPTPDTSQALSHITITACRFQPGTSTTTSGWTPSRYGPQYSSTTSGTPEGVYIAFINDSPATATKVTFSVAFAGTLDSTPSTNSSVKPGARSHWLFALGTFARAPRVPLPVRCSVQSVVRDDGTGWPTAPAPSPSASRY